MADMQRRQREQEQFSMFEDMIRQQDRQHERHHINEFNTPAPHQDDTLLIPGIQGPPLPYLESPTPPQSPQYPSANHSAPSAPGPAAPPNFDRSLKPGDLSNNSTACLKSSANIEQPLVLCFQVVTLFLCVSATLADGLRQIAVPAELCSNFLRLANNNTIRAVETCGILCGRLV